MPIQRLNWGCGANTPYGWINSDICTAPGIDLVADIRQGMPCPDNTFDYIVSIHALPELAYVELDPALTELLRVLKPGGWLRLGLPDMDRAIQAYRQRDIDYFLIGDDVIRSLAGKMMVQLTWFGRSRTMYTQEIITELLERNRYVQVRTAEYQQTHSPHAGITDLDNRPLESLFVEAIKP